MATANGERQIGYHGEAARRFGELDPARIGRRAADRAIEKLGPRPLATQKLPERLEIVSALSMTATGKVQKHILRADIKNKLGVT